MLTERSSAPVSFPLDESRTTEGGTPIALPQGNVTMHYFYDFSWVAELLQDAITHLKTAEMSDSELIAAAESTGTFEFWNDPSEDVYNGLNK